MRRVAGHIVAALVLVSLLLACSGRPRIIPRATLTDIYADMFLADQWLKDNHAERKAMDTTLFYDPIFAKYGYTFEDYDATVKKYIRDPEKFAKVFRTASEKLKKDGARYGKLAAKIKENREFNELFKNYKSVDFDADSLLWSPDSIAIDSLVRDSLALDSLRLDSLALDSLRRDSLRIDSLARAALVADSLRRDSILRRNLRRDSLRREFLKRDTLSRRRGKTNITRITND